jgi:hypothetical protein
MEPIIKVGGKLINLRNVAYIDYYMSEIVFNYEIGGSRARLNFDHIADFRQIVEEQIEKINTQVFN